MNHDYSRELRRFEDIWRRVEEARHGPPPGHRPPPPPPGPFPPPPPPPGRPPCCRAVRFNPHGRRWL